MVGNVVQGCRIDEDVWSCEIVSPAGRRAWAVWHARDQAIELKIAARQGIHEIHNLKGETVFVPSRTRRQPIDGSPVLMAQSGFLRDR